MKVVLSYIVVFIISLTTMFSQKSIVNINSVDSQIIVVYDTLGPKDTEMLKLAKNDLIRMIEQINNTKSIIDLDSIIKKVHIFLYSMGESYHNRVYSALKIETEGKDYYYSYGKDEFALNQRGIKPNSSFFECLIEELFNSKTSSIGHYSMYVSIQDNDLTKLLITDKLNSYKHISIMEEYLEFVGWYTFQMEE